MARILGFYSSTYAEPRNNMKSLGGAPSVLLGNANSLGQVFNNVPEFESTSKLEDFRIIYLVNMSQSNIAIKSAILTVTQDYASYLDRSTKLYLAGIKLNIFNPSYSAINYEHPLITADGTFRDSGLSIKSIIKDEAGTWNYGKSIVVNTDLKTGQFVPLVLHRTVRGPISYIRDFRFKINARFSVRDSYE